MQPAAFAEQMITRLSMQVGSEEFELSSTPGVNEYCRVPSELVRRVPRYYVRATLCNTNALQWPSLIEQPDLFGAFDHHFASHLTGRSSPMRKHSNTCSSYTRMQGFRDVVLGRQPASNVEAAKRVGMTAFQVQRPVEAEHALREAEVLPVLATNS